MPKQTFLNLKIDKQTQLTNAFMREFTIHKYDDASVSKVLKDLGLAKGSFYQYFENKEDLFDYLFQTCMQMKMKYVGHVTRADYSSFWLYWKAMYEEGIQFDLEHPEMSTFGFAIMDTMNSPSSKEKFDKMRKMGIEGMKAMIAPEVENGMFRSDISLDIMAYYLMQSGTQLFEFLKLNQTIDFNTKIKTGKPLFEGKNKKIFLDTLDEFIVLISGALDKKQ